MQCLDYLHGLLWAFPDIEQQQTSAGSYHCPNQPTEDDIEVRCALLESNNTFDTDGKVCAAGDICR